MEKTSKAQTFIGFLLKSGKYKIGANACATLKKAYAVIVCKTATDNAKKQANKLANRFNCPVYVLKNQTLEEITHRPNAKILAVCDRALLCAILSDRENDFISEN